MKAPSFLPLILTTTAAFTFTTAQAENTKPNILILYGDDLGFGDLTSYNPDSKLI